MIVVLGATGKTGGEVATKLLSLGKAVRVVGRSRTKLAAFEKAGADVVVGDVEDGTLVQKALAGAKAAYLLIPPNMVTEDFRAYQKRITENLVTAVSANSVKHVVMLSSLGAEHATGTGPIVGLHELEERLKKIPGIHALFLRAGFFMHNFFSGLGMMKEQGIYGSPAPATAPLPFIFPGDIGTYAALRLSSLDFAGTSAVNLIGPQLISTEDALRALGTAVSKTFRYVEFPFEVAEKGMVQAGLKPQLAALYVEMYRGASQGLLGAEPGTKTEYLSTTIDTFAQTIFAPAFRG